MVAVETRIEAKRCCGWRKPGGIYLVADGPAARCGRLPLPLCICPTCGGGIKPTRGWTWINAASLAATVDCKAGGWFDAGCAVCPMGGKITRAGLLWIGHGFYANPNAFAVEAARQGISRRINAMPKGFAVGETWVLLAHRKAIQNPDGTWAAAIFAAFCPQRIEYVVKDDDPESKLEKLAKRGFTLVRVKRAGEIPELEMTQ